ncbi:MAG: hypothetical protein V1914_01345 [archaeon]
MSNKKIEIQTVKEFLDKKFPEGIPNALRKTLEAIPLYESIQADKLRKKLKISANALTRRLLRLEEEYPELISRNFIKGKQMYEVTFNKPSLEESKTLEDRIMANPEGIKTKNLYLGEMGFGTKAYDPEAMTGLAYYLQYNNSTDINNVMMLGALFPRIPEYYSVSGSEDMRFLAKDPTKKPGEETELGEVIEYFAQRMKINPDDAKYFKEHVEGKIKTRQDAANAVKPELEKLANVLGEKTEWHYQHGEEDRKNIQVAKEILIADAEEKKKEESGQYKQEKKRLEQELKELQKKQDSINQKKTFVAYVSGRLENTKEKTGEDLINYLDGLLKSKIPQFELTRADKSELVAIIISKGVTKESIFEEAKKLKSQASNIENDKKQLESQIKEQDHKLNAVKRHSGASGFYKGTKQYKVEADEEEALFRIAKKDYNNFLYSACPKKIMGKFHVHSSAFNELTDPLSNEKTGRAPIIGNNEEYIRIQDESGLVYLLAHNPNLLNSNATTKKDLKMMKDEVKRLVKMYDILGGPIPDVTLSSHGRGGFRFQYQMKFRETIMHGQNRLIPEIVLHMKLPTLQSIPKLEALRNRGLRNVHTKRYNQGCFATGAVVHTKFENGKDYIEFIDEHSLKEFAQIGKQIEYKKSEIKEAKKQEDESLIAKLKGELSDLEKILKVQDNLVKIELDGDSHMGSANEPGRRSNYEVVDAAQRYQKKYGLPDVMIISEAIHAEIPGICATNQQYLGLVPKKFEKLLEDITNSDLDDKEKIRRLKRVSKEQVHATPITHLDVTLREWKARCMPYILEVLEKGGRIILVSGNHYNKAGSGRDEAEAMANAIPAQYENQVEVFHARGDSIGCGETVLPGGKTLYTTHKLKEGPDEFVNALEQILRQGITSDLVAHFDRHHGGGAYADNTAYAMAPGRQTWNKYVDQISKLSSPAGITNVYLPKDNKIKYVRWEWALGNCLEKYFMEPMAREQSLLPRKSYIPQDPESQGKKKP